MRRRMAQPYGKFAILSLLVTAAEIDAATAAEHLGSSPEAASMLLLRLTRQGLLRREIDPDRRAFFYSLTEKGKARWAYFKHHSHQQGDDGHAA